MFLVGLGPQPCGDSSLKKPRKRPDIPPRTSDNDKRRLHPAPDAGFLAQLESTASFVGSPKHKLAPMAFGLPLYTGKRGDESLCDEHAGFQPPDMASIPAIMRRGIRAGLIGHLSTIIWAVSDVGWIFEGRITNPGRSEYHGYPVRPSEAIAELVYRRFAAWAARQGTKVDKKAATNCQALYGFR